MPLLTKRVINSHKKLIYIVLHITIKNIKYASPYRNVFFIRQCLLEKCIKKDSTFFISIYFTEKQNNYVESKIEQDI